MEEKKKYLFYYEESENAWIPVPEKIENMIDVSMFDHEEGQEIRFKCFEMTKEEFEALPLR